MSQAPNSESLDYYNFKICLDQLELRLIRLISQLRNRSRLFYSSTAFILLTPEDELSSFFILKWPSSEVLFT